MNFLVAMDIAVFKWINGLPHPSWTEGPALLIHQILDSKTLPHYLAILFIAGLFRKDKKTCLAAVFLWVIFLISYQAADFLKTAIGRARPCVSFKDVYFLGKAAGTSFPAVAAATSAAAGLFTAWVWPKRSVKIMAACFIAFIGIFRIYTGRHYPSDIFAGWVLGVAVSLPFIALSAFVTFLIVKTDRSSAGA